MERRKSRYNPDWLALDAKAATDAGMSYGQWMATHPGGMKKILGYDEPEEPDERLMVCQCCGKTFKVYKTSRGRKFCDECRERLRNAHYRNAYKNRNESVENERR